MGGGGLRTLFTALAVFLIAATPAAADPALWVAQANGATLYFFGTVHALQPGMAWTTPRIEKALAASEDLWIEVADTDATSVGPLVKQLGFDPAHPLSSLLTPEEEQQLDTAAKSVGLPGAAAMEPMRPWFAGLTIAAAPFHQAGYDPQIGADKVLQAEAQSAGKPVHGLETLDQQIHFLADLPQKQQLDLLREALSETGNATQEITALINAWSSGNVEALSHMDEAEIRDRSPALYRKLIIKRNDAWADRLTRLSHDGGTHFIAVGAAHLAGPDSVQNALERRGIRVTRLPD